MMRGSSGAAASDFDKALALIAGCAFPEETKARLVELRDAEAAAQEAMKVANQGSANLRKDREAFEASQAERVAALDARERDIERENEELSKRRALVKREDDALIMSKAALADDRKKFEAEKVQHGNEVLAAAAANTERRRSLDEKHKAADARDEALNARAIKLAEGEAALKARVDELNDATAKFRVK